MKVFFAIPWFAWLLVAANLAMLGGPESDPLINIIVSEFSIPSGRQVLVTVADLLLLAGVICLWVEVFKATRTSVASIVDHALSLVVFVVYLIEFLIVDRVGNTTFLILTVMAFTDVVSGFTVTISTAKRDFTLG